MADQGSAAVDPGTMLRSRRFVALLLFASVVGFVVSVLSWCFLELVHRLQEWVFTDIPRWLGFDGAPWWWPLPVLPLAGVLTAFAVTALPGRGGHLPALGLATGGARPVELPGVLLAAVATLGFGLVLGPEAPLLALGGGLGLLALRALRRDVPDQAAGVIAAAGSFAALSFIFGSPVIAAVILIEAAGLGGAALPVVLLPCLLAAAVGSLTFTGMGAWTGLDTSALSIGVLRLPEFARPGPGDFAWTVVLAATAALVAYAALWAARYLARLVVSREHLLLPVAGLVVAGLAVAYAQISGQDVGYVLFSGQESIGPLAVHAPAWPLWSLALLIACKTAAWSISLAGFRGGPTFPALFVGAAGGVLAAHLPGLALTPAVAVGMGAMTVAVLRLPLSAIVLALLLTSESGLGASPLIIVGVVVAYLITLALPPAPAVPQEPPPPRA